MRGEGKGEEGGERGRKGWGRKRRQEGRRERKREERGERGREGEWGREGRQEGKRGPGEVGEKACIGGKMLEVGPIKQHSGKASWRPHWIKGFNALVFTHLLKPQVCWGVKS